MAARRVENIPVQDRGWARAALISEDHKQGNITHHGGVWAGARIDKIIGKISATFNIVTKQKLG